VLTVVAIAAAAGPACGSSPANLAPPAVTLTVDSAHPGRALPGDYLGLSFEASVLDSPLLNPAVSNLPELLRDLGMGRIRFGGNSLDRVAAWSPDPGRPLPPWAHTRVRPEDLGRLGALAAATGWRVDLGLTLGHFDAAAAANEAAAARRLIGSGLGTVNIGNEPDLFPARYISAGYTYAGYRSQVDRYRAAISAAAPGTELAGPDTAGPGWLAAFGQDEHRGLAFLTQHFYPLTRCGGNRPSIAELTSGATARREQEAADAAVSAAHGQGLALRLDETNSASCGGQDGVSNTLASALWMVDYLLLAAQRGVDGVNVHGGLAACRGYSPLCLPGTRAPVAETEPGIDPIADLSLGAGQVGPSDKARLTAQPDFYGLLLVHQLEGGRWLPISSDPPGRLDEFALRMPDGSMRIVLDNPDPHMAMSARVRLAEKPASGAVLRLTGPSLGATSQVALAGTEVNDAGSWQPRTVERLPITGPVVEVGVGAASAALVTLSP
jgi:hypothetical protein